MTDDEIAAIATRLALYASGPLAVGSDADRVWIEHHDRRWAVATFITYAGADIQALLDEVSRLRAELARCCGDERRPHLGEM